MQDEDIPGLVRRFYVRSGILTGPATLQGMAGFQFLPGIGLSA